VTTTDAQAAETEKAVVTATAQTGEVLALKTDATSIENAQIVAQQEERATSMEARAIGTEDHLEVIQDVDHRKLKAHNGTITVQEDARVAQSEHPVAGMMVHLVAKQEQPVDQSRAPNAYAATVTSKISGNLTAKNDVETTVEQRTASPHEPQVDAGKAQIGHVAQAETGEHGEVLQLKHQSVSCASAAVATLANTKIEDNESPHRL